ncbi:hypothetical protein [Flavobacterium sp. JP2137]|uniref:hypothetical protein n=1 Tax=Flavobacterium sp. JP2137 TaxID=3414510 RepID=UPI003D2FA8B3
MRISKLPFDIGIDYEELELVLEVLAERIEGYDSYLYIGEEVYCICNYPADKMELIFHWDVLQAVIVSFKNELPFLSQLNQGELKTNLLEVQTELETNESYFVGTIGNNTISLFRLVKITYLIYGDSILLAKLRRTLLS